jgi:catechol 2,3-dioxygenase-like lactoylglutathione lyase family enzyme
VVGIQQDEDMIFGAHLVLFSRDADADRSFLTEVFGLESVDAGGGWLVFALPSAETAVHPADGFGAELYLMCDDLSAEMEYLADRGAVFSDVQDERWGSVTKIKLPSGGELGLYEPRHPTAFERPSALGHPNES